MKSEDLLDAIGQVNEQDVADAARVKRKAPWWARTLGAAACLCLVCMGAFALLFGGMGASAGAGGGNFAGGWYYYQLNGGDVYRHNPEQGCEKVLSSWQYDTWDVNENGLYYKQNRRLYLVDHDSGEKRLLYRSGLFESSHIGFELYGDDVIVSVYNKRRDSVYEVLIDGESGAVLQTVMELEYDYDFFTQFSDLNFLVGDRHLTLVPANGEGYRFYLTENGERLTESQVTQWPDWCDGGLWFDIYDESDEQSSYFVVYPEGEELLVLSHVKWAVADGYMYWWEYDTSQPAGADVYTLMCMDVHTGETWPMEVDTPGLSLDVLATDGQIMYSSFFNAKSVACWEIVYDSSRPSALHLLDADIND